MDKQFFEHISHAFEAPLKSPVLIFSLVLFIILIVSLLLKPIKVPGIIGLIVCGVIIGPHGLNWLEKNSAVDLFSTIGLLYIMFIAGLELDMNEFKKTKNRSFLFGFFTFFFPIILGFPVCYYLLGYDFLGSMLIASMFATHTLVSYPIVNNYGISKNEAVAITIGGTILTDTAVLIILAVISGAAQGNINQQFWVTLGVSFTIFLFILFGVIPRIALLFFEKVKSEKTTHYIFILTVVFFSAFLAEVAGLEPIIGAFAAGLALNKFIPHSSALMNRIEFIGNAIFIPFFLISVGMIVDVRVLLHGPEALIIAATLTVVALVGKYFASWLTQKVFKYTSSQRNLIFGLSSAHAAATLAVIMVGYRNHIIDENALNGTILLILVTCVVATMITENASKKIVMAGLQDSSHADVVNAVEEHILIPISNIRKMEPILDFAMFIKSKKSPHAINILSVVKNNHEAEANKEYARKQVESMEKYASGSETPLAVVSMIDYNLASGIHCSAEELSANLVILGWPNVNKFVDKIVGGKHEGILSATPANIMVCHFVKPFITNKRIQIFVPPMGEAEYGFEFWLEKMIKLATEVSLPIIFVLNNRTKQAIEAQLKIHKTAVSVEYEYEHAWDNVETLKQHAKENSFLVYVLAREGDVSYRSIFNGIEHRLEKKFETENMVVIYPSRVSNEHIDEYEDVQPSPILRKISQEIGNIFNREN